VKVLISLQQHVPHWQIPPEAVDILRTHFPHIDFIYATTDQERAAGLAECDVAYTWILRAHELNKRFASAGSTLRLSPSRPCVYRSSLAAT
jgi:hypothetical protein